MKKHTLIITCLLICLILLFGILQYFQRGCSVEEIPLKEGEFKHNSDGTTSIGLNMCALGFYDIKTNTKFKSGSVIRPVQGKIEGRISYQQNYPEASDYILIVMIDYKKHDFIVNGTTYSDYFFTLEKKDSIDIDIQIEGLENAHDFTFFLVNNVKVLHEKENLTNWMLRETKFSFSERFLLNESISSVTEVEKSSSINEFDAEGNFIIDLVESHEIYNPISTCNSGDELEVVIHNYYSIEMKYAVFGFLDWEQISLDNEGLVRYVTIPPETSIYFKVKIPDVNTYKYFQVYYIPNANSSNVKRFYPQSTYKILVIP